MTNPPPGFSSIISVPRPYDKKGAPGCGLYLATPEPLQMALFSAQIHHVFRAINGSKYEKNMHALELRFPAEIYDKEREEASLLVGMCKRNGIVPVVRGDLGLAVECDADGLMLKNVADVAEARHVLGEKAIIGMDCGNSREKAEEALAAGVDYVQFSHFYTDADLSLLAWWSTRTHLPAVAFGKLDVQHAISMFEAGAGFIGAGDWVWHHEEGPARAIYWLQESIEHGLSKLRVN